MEVDQIIGRDYILAKEIYPRLKKRKGFILVGQRGIGKSTILKWAYKHYEGEKVYHSCRQGYAMFIRACAKEQGVENVDKAKVVDIEREIFKNKEIAIFMDDFERATPKLLHILTALSEIWPVYLAGNEPFREEARRILWGKQKIKLAAIAKHERIKLATYISQKTGSHVSISEIATASRGIPGRAWAIARGEVVRQEAERVQGEEINIAPVLLVLVVLVVAIRYIGIGMGEKDLYVLGGLGMAVGVILRYMIFRSAT